MKAIKNFYAIFATLTLLSIGACSDSEELGYYTTKSLNETINTIDLTNSEKEAMDAIASFSSEITKATFNVSDDGNLCISPVSIAIYLGMTANATTGEIHNQILDILGIADMETLNSLCRKLMRYLPCNDNGSSMQLFNRFWVKKGIKVPDNFRKTIGEYYYADIEMVDFTKPSTVPAINKWVSEATHDKITSLLDGDWSNYVETEKVSANTVYFLGKWHSPFDINNTCKKSFYSSGKEYAVDMMKNERMVSTVFHNDYVVGVALDFEESVNTMYLYLPIEGMAISEFMELFTFEQQKKLRESAEPAFVNLSMPSFTVASRPKIADALHNLGLLTGNADFSPMGITGQANLELEHKTYLKIDEKGVELAAVTGGIVHTYSAPDPETREITLEFNRPFVYSIVNNKTGAVLMTGVVNRI